MKKTAKSKATKKAKNRRKPTGLEGTLYCYVQTSNEKYAKTEGAKKFGSYSNYVNGLISKDRGIKPRSGAWKAKTESKTA